MFGSSIIHALTHSLDSPRSVPGHPNCLHATEPVNNLPLMRALVNDLQQYNSTTLPFHWYDFEHQNNLVVQLFRQSQLNVTVLPAYHVNLLRPDLHRINSQDCLHNCYPGKMDVYSQMLLHFLTKERPPAVQAAHEAKYQLAMEQYQKKKMAGAAAAAVAVRGNETDSKDRVDDASAVDATKTSVDTMAAFTNDPTRPEAGANGAATPSDIRAVGHGNRSALVTVA